MSNNEPAWPRISLVGPCGAGKSTLSKALRTLGYTVRQPAQEHSYVPHMWQRLTQPDLLIYLDLSFESLVTRRPNTHGGPERLAEQHSRLAHAHAHCNLYLDTSHLTPAEVLEQVLALLNQPEQRLINR
jgi:shikimate kinase